MDGDGIFLETMFLEEVLQQLCNKILILRKQNAEALTYVMFLELSVK